tara:strand:+ start:3235 stop:3456 length:222 start_codon:yes stop_codon:yes gene_type:complete
LLRDSDLTVSTEILANVFIELGVSSMETESYAVNQKNIIETVLNDVKQNGETIPNSLARQGLLILSWLNKEKI